MRQTFMETAPATWAGKDLFVICGGSSVNPREVQGLRGLPNVAVVVINMSYQIAPWANALFFADDRWWKREWMNRRDELLAFEGEMFTTANNTGHERLRHYKRVKPTAEKPFGDGGTIALRTTSLMGVLNLAHNARVRTIILIGADNRDSDEGRAHYHAEYDFGYSVTTYETQRAELELAVAPLEAAHIPVYNTSPISALPWWPKIRLAEVMDWAEHNHEGAKP